MVLLLVILQWVGLVASVTVIEWPVAVWFVKVYVPPAATSNWVPPSIETL